MHQLHIATFYVVYSKTLDYNIVFTSFIKAHFIKYLYFFDELDALEFYSLSIFICIIEKYINID